ncbi:hypothetical protein ACFL00_02500 [Pseudomonadota bacterium]
MQQFIIPVLLLIVFFVGFGLTHRRGQGAAGCAGCTTCVDKTECKEKGKP